MFHPSDISLQIHDLYQLILYSDHLKDNYFW